MNDMLSEGKRMNIVSENEMNSTSALIRRGDNSIQPVLKVDDELAQVEKLMV